MDNLTPSQRSFNMSRIRSSDTNLEQKFFSLLDEQKIKFLRHPKIYGKPDCQIGKKLLIFIDSDFWHGWQFPRWKNRLPQKYWVGKIENNIKRDSKKFRILKKSGYKVIRIWEHQILENKEKVKERIIDLL